MDGQMGACINEWGQDGKKEGLTKWMDRWVHVIKADCAFWSMLVFQMIKADWCIWHFEP